jgi:hypothetical protein
MSAYAKAGNCSAIPTDTSKYGIACTTDNQLCGDTSATGTAAPDFSCSCREDKTTGNTAFCAPRYVSGAIVNAAKTYYAALATAGCEQSSYDPSTTKACQVSGYKQFVCSQAIFQAANAFTLSACGSFDYISWCNGASSVGVSVVALVALIAAAFTAAF